MTDNSDYTDIHKLFAELPEVTLPDSLRADALFARMDAQPTATPSTQPATKSNVISITRRLRPVLSYAAVFAVLVLVYYGAGVDKMTAIDEPQAEPQTFMMAADNAPAPAAAQPQMAAESAPANAPMLADAPPPADGDGLAKAAPRMATMEADAPANELGTGELVDELDFGELRATVRQLTDTVTIDIVKLSDPSSVLRTIVQEGSYTYMGKLGKDEPQLLVATTTATGTSPAGVDDLHSYPTSSNDRYMVLTVLSGTDCAAAATTAVRGSNLILQSAGDNTFVIFSDAKQDATAVDTITLGSATIELR